MIFMGDGAVIKEKSPEAFSYTKSRSESGYSESDMRIVSSIERVRRPFHITNKRNQASV